MYGAYHEAGHFVIAAARGLALRPDGLMVISNGNGFCVYATQPDKSDPSRESVILSSFAGYWAAQRFCNEHSCSELLDPVPQTSRDWQDARKIIGELSEEYLTEKSLMTVQLRLEQESKRLVDQYWPPIEALAMSLLAKDPEPMRPLKTGERWSNETEPVRYMEGAEAAAILVSQGIAAICEPKI
jgi:hypothetical protein